MSDIRTGAAPLTDPEDLLAVEAARRYYLDERSKQEIAKDLRVSRFKVARLLERARARGLVNISIRSPSGVDVELGDRLRERFGLNHAVVVSSFESDGEVMRSLLGRAAADLLTDLVRPSDVLGLGWARSVLAAAEQLDSIAPCRVVQLTGALTRPEGEMSSVELARRVAQLGGGSALCFYAPMFVASRDTAEALLAEEQVATAVRAYPDVTKAVVGIGGWSPPNSTLRQAMAPEERAVMEVHGVYADLSGVLLDSDGNEVVTPLSERIIAISADQLRAVPEVIALAYGDAKVGAALAALHGGYVDSLITHTTFAEQLLAA